MSADIEQFSKLKIKQNNVSIAILVIQFLVLLVGFALFAIRIVCLHNEICVQANICVYINYMY